MKNLKFLNNLKTMAFALLFGFPMLVSAQTPTDPWFVGGNTVSTVPFNPYLGTLDKQPLHLITNNTPRITILENGRVGFGIIPSSNLHLHSDYYCTDLIPQGQKDIDSLEFDSTTEGIDDSTRGPSYCNIFLMTTKETGTKIWNGFVIAQEQTSVTMQQQEKAPFNIFGLNGGMTIIPNGYVGFGTPYPQQKIHVVGENILISRTSSPKAPGSTNGSMLFGADVSSSQSPFGEWGIEYVNGANETPGLNFWKCWNNTGSPWFNYALFLQDNGNVGIGTNFPQRKLDVKGDIAAKETIALNEGNISCLSLGNACGTNLGYGTSYIGFNAIRNNANGTWKLEGDGAHNGGAVIWSTVGGDIFFASIPSSGAGFRTLTDAQLKQNVKLQLLPDGVLQAKEVLVSLTGWPDFVFENEYTPMTLQETEAFIKENKHLPNIPNAVEVEENGILLGEMQGKLLQKIEELTLYLIEQQKQSVEQQKLIEELQKRLSELENKKGGE